MHPFVRARVKTYIHTCSETPDADRQTDRQTYIHTLTDIKLAGGYIRVLLLTGIQIYTGIHMNTGELPKYRLKSMLMMKKTVFDAFILLCRHLRVRMRKIMLLFAIVLMLLRFEI